MEKRIEGCVIFLKKNMQQMTKCYRTMEAHGTKAEVQMLKPKWKVISSELIFHLLLTIGIASIYSDIASQEPA